MSIFQDQIALVTGAGSPAGIGYAIARRLGMDGATLAIISTTGRIHERAEELKKEGFPTKSYIADLTKPEAVQHIVDNIATIFGRLDHWVSAGMPDGSRAPWSDLAASISASTMPG